VVANRCVIRVGARACIVALDVVETERRQHCRCRGSSLVLAGRAALSARDVGATNPRRIQDLPSSPREHLEPAGEARTARNQGSSQMPIDHRTRPSGCPSGRAPPIRLSHKSKAQRNAIA
jgi:hypothetical protein